MNRVRRKVKRCFCHSLRGIIFSLFPLSLPSSPSHPLLTPFPLTLISTTKSHPSPRPIYLHLRTLCSNNNNNSSSSNTTTTITAGNRSTCGSVTSPSLAPLFSLFPSSLLVFDIINLNRNCNPQLQFICANLVKLTLSLHTQRFQSINFSIGFSSRIITFLHLLLLHLL